MGREFSKEQQRVLRQCAWRYVGMMPGWMDVEDVAQELALQMWRNERDMLSMPMPQFAWYADRWALSIVRDSTASRTTNSHWVKKAAKAVSLTPFLDEVEHGLEDWSKSAHNPGLVGLRLERRVESYVQVEGKQERDVEAWRCWEVLCRRMSRRNVYIMYEVVRGRPQKELAEELDLTQSMITHVMYKARRIVEGRE